MSDFRHGIWFNQQGLLEDFKGDQSLSKEVNDSKIIWVNKTIEALLKRSMSMMMSDLLGGYAHGMATDFKNGDEITIAVILEKSLTLTAMERLSPVEVAASTRKAIKEIARQSVDLTESEIFKYDEHALGQGQVLLFMGQHLRGFRQSSNRIIQTIAPNFRDDFESATKTINDYFESLPNQCVAKHNQQLKTIGEQWLVKLEENELVTQSLMPALRTRVLARIDQFCDLTQASRAGEEKKKIIKSILSEVVPYILLNGVARLNRDNLKASVNSNRASVEVKLGVVGLGRRLVGGLKFILMWLVNFIRGFRKEQKSDDYKIEKKLKNREMGMYGESKASANFETGLARKAKNRSVKNTKGQGKRQTQRRDSPRV